MNSLSRTLVLTAVAAVGEEVGVAAAGVLQRVGQDRQEVKAPVVINALGQLHYGAVLSCGPGRIEADKTDGVAEYVSDYPGE